jgi:nucleoside-diphosphate-sugar epimerase
MTEKLLKHKKLIFVLADVFIIAFSIYLSFLLRFDWQIPSRVSYLILPSMVVAVLVTIPSFFIQKIYRISWSYVSLDDIPKFVKGAFISAALFGTGFYMLRFYPSFEGLPRSIIVLYGLLLFIFATGLRFLKRTYWQMIKGELSSEKKWKEINKKNGKDGDRIKTVLLAGGAGYIGSILARKLLAEKYKVKIIDKLLFGKEPIEELLGKDGFEFIEADVNTDNEKVLSALNGVEAVVYLAAIVGDPACAAQPEVAHETNYKSAIKLARLCRERGISKFIFTSTCSNYGSGEKDKLQESSSLRPVSLYAESKIYTEKELIRMTDENFKPLIFRLSTVYGLSPRMRFDLVVNLLTKKAYREKEITIFGGEQWRPFIHVEDVADALLSAVKTPYSKISGQIFNLGATEENYQIKQIGEIIKEIVPEVNVKQVDNSSDSRDYNVSFEKIKEVFNYRPKHTVRKEVEKMYQALSEGRFPDTEDDKYYNYVPEQ